MNRSHAPAPPHLSDAEREARLAALRRRYLDTVFDDVRRMQRDLTVELGDEGRLHGFRLAVHSLKGSGGAYGFPEITARAAEVEQALLGGRGADAVAHGLGDLLAAVTGARAGLTPAPEAA